ncbi:hypothetical protein GF312_01300 [Candidatus Poribacteria bacterium]|nr:hypothetical protein [Candidatus Poribacteria bacterium]
MDHKTLDNIFQEINDEFSEMKPTGIDDLEDRVLAAMYKLGAYLMEKKVEDWNDQVRNETCPECGTKLEHKRKNRQIGTWVSDVSYQRWRSYCPQCRRYDYPLDKVLGISPRQQLSSSVQELSALCGASWDYKESEYLMQKILRRRCVSHQTVFNKTTEIGKAVSDSFDGNRVRELEDDKKLQGDYFDNLEVWKELMNRIYMDLDGVMINSRDNEKRMEGKVGVVWSKRELVKEDTYSLVDKRYMGTFCDPERFYWDIVLELYKRSGGKLDETEGLVRGDGAPFIRGFHSKYAFSCRYILDYYHLCKKVKERLWAVYYNHKRFIEVKEQLMDYLNSGDVDGALAYIESLRRRIRKRYKKKQLVKLAGYIERNRHGIWYKEAIDKGISIGAGSADKAGDILICRRMKLRGMCWSRKGADAVLSIRILVCNGEWDDFWATYKKAA